MYYNILCYFEMFHNFRVTFTVCALLLLPINCRQLFKMSILNIKALSLRARLHCKISRKNFERQHIY